VQGNDLVFRAAGPDRDLAQVWAMTSTVADRQGRDRAVVQHTLGVLGGVSEGLVELVDIDAERIKHDGDTRVSLDHIADPSPAETSQSLADGQRACVDLRIHPLLELDREC